jgi:hypothetical protein
MPTDSFLAGDPLCFELLLDGLGSSDMPRFTISVDDALGCRIFTAATRFSPSRLPPLDGRRCITCCIDELPLPAGRYTFSVWAGTYYRPDIDELNDVGTFDVEQGNFYGNGQLAHASIGKVLMRSRWEVLE